MKRQSSWVLLNTAQVVPADASAGKCGIGRWISVTLHRFSTAVNELEPSYIKLQNPLKITFLKYTISLAVIKILKTTTLMKHHLSLVRRNTIPDPTGPGRPHFFTPPDRDLSSGGSGKVRCGILTNPFTWPNNFKMNTNFCDNKIICWVTVLENCLRLNLIQFSVLVVNLFAAIAFLSGVKQIRLARQRAVVLRWQRHSARGIRRRTEFLCTFSNYLLSICSKNICNKMPVSRNHRKK